MIQQVVDSGLRTLSNMPADSVSAELIFVYNPAGNGFDSVNDSAEDAFQGNQASAFFVDVCFNVPPRYIESQFETEIIAESG